MMISGFLSNRVVQVLSDKQQENMIDFYILNW